MTFLFYLRTDYEIITNTKNPWTTQFLFVFHTLYLFSYSLPYICPTIWLQQFHEQAHKNHRIPILPIFNQYHLFLWAYKWPGNYIIITTAVFTSSPNKHIHLFKMSLFLTKMVLLYPKNTISALNMVSKYQSYNLTALKLKFSKITNNLFSRFISDLLTLPNVWLKWNKEKYGKVEWLHLTGYSLLKYKSLVMHTRMVL